MVYAHEEELDEMYVCAGLFNENGHLKSDFNIIQIIVELNEDEYDIRWMVVEKAVIIY